MPSVANEHIEGLRVSLLGPFELTVNGAAVAALHSRKEQWIFALLALRPGAPVSRSWLAGTLWPDSPEAQALAYLRRSLYHLRSALGPEAWRLGARSSRSLALNLDGSVVDAALFDAAISRGDERALEEAVRLYRGRLLEGCTEEWVIDEQRRRETQFLAALESLAQTAQAEDRSADAIPHLRRLISLDPLREPAHRSLMSALSATGAHGAMVQTYRELRLLLRRELNAEPAGETARLFAELRASAQEATHKSAASRPVAPASGPPAHTPRPLTPLLGREPEVQAMRDLLGSAALVTLTGAGGVGKTRLAVEIARSWEDEEVWYASLAPLTRPADVPRAVAVAAGIVDPPAAPAAEALAASLAARPGLLILDNCEHLLDACADLARQLLELCPALRILATSRQRLSIPGEYTYRLSPLETPTLGTASKPPAEAAQAVDDTDLATCAAYASIQLFLERARSVLPAFSLTAQNARAIAGICSRLDGIPLAIELAAARVHTLSPDEILLRLDDRFRLLSGGLRTSIPHHQTLRALVDWSFDLLDSREQVLFRRLSVFAGGWDLALAEAACADSAPGPRPTTLTDEDILDALSSLVDRSLVQADMHASPPRFHLLQTIRQYAARRLDESGERGECEGRFCAAMVAWAERADGDLRGDRHAERLIQFEGEHDNLRAALQHSVAAPDGTEACLRLCAAVGNFWVFRGYYREGADWCRQALERPGAYVRTRWRARALRSAGTLAWMQGQLAAAMEWQTESLDVYRDLRDTHGAASALERMGAIALRLGDRERSCRLLGEACDISRAIDEPRLLTNALINLGCAAEEMGDIVRAGEAWTEALTVTRSRGDRVAAALALANLGGLAEFEERWIRARELYTESLGLIERTGDKGGIAALTFNLGSVAAALGEFAEGFRLMRVALYDWTEWGNREKILVGINGLALAMVARSGAGGPPGGDRAEMMRAAELLGAAEAARSAHGFILPFATRSRYQRRIPELQAALGEPAFAECWEKGRNLSIEEAASMAIDPGP